MALNTFYQNDFKAEALELITEQFKDKPVFQKYLFLLLAGSAEALSVIKDLMQMRSLDTAVGEQLDVLGRIAGQDRVLVGADTFKYFGFDGATAASTYGSAFNDAIGGYWYSYGKPEGGNIKLNDAQYRLFIKAKIKKNNSVATVEDVLDFLSFVFDVRSFVVSSKGGTAIIRVSRRLSSFERSLMEYVGEDGGYFIPRPLGVQLQIEEPLSNGTLGFLGTPFALGMVSLYTVNPTGGVFGSALTEE